MNTNSNQPVLYPSEEQRDLSQIFYFFAENKWLIILITCATLVCGIFFLSMQIPQYQADAIIQIEDAKGGSGIHVGRNLATMLDGASSENASAIQMALIRSRYILSPVIQANGLDIVAEPKQLWIMRKLVPFVSSSKKIQVKSFKTPPKLLNKGFSLVYDKPGHFCLYSETGELIIQGAIGRLITSTDHQISLEIEAIDAPLGSEFILKKQPEFQAIQSLLKHFKITDLGSGRQPTGVLQITLTGPDPEKLMHVLDSIANIVSNKNAEKKSLEAAKTLTFLHQQLPLAKKSLEKAETDLSKYRTKSGQINIKAQSQALFAQLVTLDKQRAKLQIDKVNKLRRYTLEHPLMFQLNDRIKGIDRVRHQLEKKLKHIPVSDQIAVSFMRDVKATNSLYLILLNKIQELKVIKEGTISDVHILSYAKLPQLSLPPRRDLVYVWSIFLGLLLSAVIILMRKNFSPRVNDPHWCERKFGIVNLAIIPYSKEQSTNMGQFKNTSKVSPPLLAFRSTHNSSIESLRSLRTSLHVSLCSTSNNIITILGISPAVGKTFISCNLAYLLATSGKRVLLIDADLRRGALHNQFNIPSKPGLADLLTSKATREQVITEGCHPNLSILPCGNYPSDPSELLMSEVFKKWLKTFSKDYDLVIIDTAPLLWVTDGVLVGTLSGINFLVLGANMHRPTEIEMTAKRLSSAGVKLDGTIFNFHTSKIKQGYDYGGYKYHSTP